MKRRRLCHLLTGLVTLGATFGSFAQTAAPTVESGYPTRPIRLVIPWQAGGGTDTLVRLLAERLQPRLGQPVVVENKPGGSTIIGTKAFLAAPPDGYTLLISTNTTFSIVPHLFKVPPFDPEGAFEPVSLLASTPMALVVHPSLGVQDLQGFVEAARKRPGEITIASYGNGTSTHLVAELFQSAAGIKLNHVPFKGVEAVHAVSGGQVSAMVDGLFTALPQIRAGRIRGLAVLQSQRSEFAPEIPSVTESGLRGVDIDIWYGLVAPRGTPAPIVERLSREFAAVLKMPEVRERLAAMQVVPIAKGPQEARAHFRQQSDLYRGLVRNTGVQLE